MRACTCSRRSTTTWCSTSSPSAGSSFRGRTEMVNVVYCMRRRADLSLEQFLDHWGKVHAPIVTENLSVLRLVGYQRLVPSLHEMSPQIERRNVSQPPYDGIAILTWQSEEDLTHSLQ